MRPPVRCTSPSKNADASCSRSRCSTRARPSPPGSEMRSSCAACSPRTPAPWKSSCSGSPRRSTPRTPIWNAPSTWPPSTTATRPSSSGSSWRTSRRPSPSSTRRSWPRRAATGAGSIAIPRGIYITPGDRATSPRCCGLPPTGRPGSSWSPTTNASSASAIRAQAVWASPSGSSLCTPLPPASIRR